MQVQDKRDGIAPVRHYPIEGRTAFTVIECAPRSPLPPPYRLSRSEWQASGEEAVFADIRAVAIGLLATIGLMVLVAMPLIWLFRGVQL